MKNTYVKMEGLGNSFVVFEGPQAFYEQEIEKLCSENKTDGFLVVTTISESYVRMEYWNADGSVAEMCGNGLRCVARFAVDNRFVSPGEFTVNTGAGDLQVFWSGENANRVEVQVGQVQMLDSINIGGEEFQILSVGNPHALKFVDDVDIAPVSTLGPLVENSTVFPNKTNVEFVEIISSSHIKLRVWERGVGETLACGTGMVAAAKAAVELKNLKFPVKVEVLGGAATVWIDDTGYARMIGPANYIPLL